MRAAVMTLLAFFSVPAHSQSLCMSDAELRAYLRVVVLTSYGVTLGECAKSHRALRSEFIAFGEEIEKLHSSAMKDQDEVAILPFKRVFSDRAIVEYHKAVDGALSSHIATVGRFTFDQCRSSKLGIEVLMDAKSRAPSSTVMLRNLDRSIGSVFSAERANVSRC